MSVALIGPALELIKMGAERIWPDPNKRAEQLQRLEELKQSGDITKLNAELSLLMGQLKVNEVEAANPSLFVSGWRPATGWVCAISLFMYYVPYCLVAVVIWAHQCIISGIIAPRPDLGVTDLIVLLTGMLGLSGMRMNEKLNNVANK